MEGVARIQRGDLDNVLHVSFITYNRILTVAHFTGDPTDDVIC